MERDDEPVSFAPTVNYLRDSSINKSMKESIWEVVEKITLNMYKSGFPLWLHSNEPN